MLPKPNARRTFTMLLLFGISACNNVSMESGGNTSAANNDESMIPVQALDTLAGESGFEAWSWSTTQRKLDDNSAVYLGDVNGDGRSDMIVVGSPGTADAGRIFVSLNNLGGFPSWDWVSSSRMLQDNDLLQLADVNGDQKMDLVARGGPGNANAGRLYVALSNGTGFPQWTWSSSSRMVDDASRVFFGKANQDDRSDLIAIGAAGTANAGRIFVATSNGSGYPAWTWSSSSRMVDDNSRVFLSDVDPDGLVDLIGVGAPGAANAGKVYVARSNGTGYPAWTWSSANRMLNDNDSMYLAYVNADDMADIVAVGAPGTTTAGRVFVAASNGTGYPSWTWNSANRVLDDNAKMWLVDTDGDHRADLVAQGAANAANAGYIFVAASNGTGFPSWTWNSGARMVDDNSKLWFADMNNDQRNDLIAEGAAGKPNAGFLYVGLANPGGNCPFSGGAVTRTLYPNGSLTLRKSCSPYLVDSSIAIYDDCVLNVEPGVTVKFGSGGTLLVGVQGLGKLVASGSSTDFITFTSQEEDPSPGSWRGLVFGGGTANGSRIAYARITAAGQNQDGALVADDLPAHVLTLDSLSIDKVGDGASGILALGDKSSIAISNSTFWDISEGRHPISISAASFDGIGTGNLYPAGSSIEIMGGTVDTSAIWINPGLPVAITSDVIVQGSNNPVLTLRAGMNLKFGANVALQVGRTAPGKIVIAGTSPLARITLTSLASEPQPGDWAGLQIWGSGKAAISYTDFRYGGSNSGDSLGNVTVESTAPSVQLAVDHSSFSNSLGRGIYVPCAPPGQPAAFITVDNNTTYWNNALGTKGPGLTCD